ncbi:MAG TPA: erythromycin esterase family protein [Kofleriaceae bacterium]|nr:erythromycin esterase family protein [Kofleriaceae bacterium]
MTRKLISKHGFTGVAIEADWPEVLRIDRYVRRRDDDESVADALAGFGRFPMWMWHNAEVAAFVEWLGAWNSRRALEARAGFYGLDLYSRHTSIRAVLSFLHEIDPAAFSWAREGYGCFDHAGGGSERGRWPTPSLTRACEAELVAQLVEMQRRHAARSGRAPNGDSWFHAMQKVRVIKDAEAYYRTMFGGRSASWNLRDTHMADTLDLLADQLGRDGRPARLVVWAHNSHIGDARATVMAHRHELTLGQLIRQRHPGEVALIGMTTHTGSVLCAHDWDDPAIPEHVMPSLSGSWERLFHGAGMQRFYVTSASLKRIIGERVERLHRAIDVVYRPETERLSHYYPARLAEQFDIVIHVDTSHAVVPIEDMEPALTRAITHDLPETVTTGL